MPISPHKTVSTLGDARSDYTSFYTWDSAVDEHPDYLHIAIVSPLPHLEQEYQGFQTYLQLTDLESVVLVTSGHRLIASKLADDFRTYAGDPASFAEDRLQRTTVLPERIQEVLESVPGILTPQRSERLVERARSCLTDEQYESAVTFAHTALELATSELIISLITFNKLDRFADIILGIQPRFNIFNERTNRIYTVLTEDAKLKQQPFWSPLTDSNKRRNAIVHQGKTCSAGEAEESVRVVQEFMDYLHQVSAMLPTPQPDAQNQCV